MSVRPLARPTIYRGVAMRSRLEARYAAVMDERGDAWIYEPRCFASSEGQYLPDFGVRCDGCETTSEPHWSYDEVKPLVPKLLPKWEDMARWARIIRESEPYAHLDLAVPLPSPLPSGGFKDRFVQAWREPGGLPPATAMALSCLGILRMVELQGSKDWYP